MFTMRLVGHNKANQRVEGCSFLSECGPRSSSHYYYAADSSIARELRLCLANNSDSLTSQSNS